MNTIQMLSTADSSFEGEFKKLIFQRASLKTEVESSVRDILYHVKSEGDSALFRYTERFDGIRLDAQSVRLSSDEIERAYRNLDEPELRAFNVASQRIEHFHQEQRELISERQGSGTQATQVVRPLKKVGIYVPGGRAAYPSSVLMSAIPARVAGVEEVIMVSPTVSPHVLAAAYASKVNCVYRIGGAQAIAALAYGTKSVPRVDKIVGPGNVYVETAKRMVYGTVDLDMVAGPSEVLIIADERAVPSFVAADLLAQAEHDHDAFPLLISTSISFLQEVEKELFSQLKVLSKKDIAAHALENQGRMIHARSIDEAAEIANSFAPEHLELMVADPEELLKKISCAGAVCLGDYTPVAIGDYLAGPSHILPTGGTARFFSPLGVEDFLKRMSIISFTRDELQEVGNDARIIALLEGMDGHAQAIEKRLDLK